MTSFDASRLGALALLDWLRPPRGFVTEAALGTTYSLDLVACAAALVSLDGSARDTSTFELPALLRAMRRMGDRVHLIAQQGCIQRSDGTRADVLPLLDRFVHAVRFPLSERAFHAKVWVVRQRRVESQDEGGQAGERRYVLLVGSRNLTRAHAYDLGIALEGWADDGDGMRLAGVKEFAQHACALGGIPDFMRNFDDLDEVVWRFPSGVTEMEFGFHGARKQPWKDTALARLAEATGLAVLCISPFLDAETVVELAQRFAGWPERCLVAGEHDLDRVSRTRARDALSSLEPRSMLSASEEPPARTLPAAEPHEAPGDDAQTAEDEDRGDDDLWQASRGLHAKAIVTWQDERTASVLLGSANLSRRGWRGDNVEAWLRLTGKAGLANVLWDWSMSEAAEYTLAEPSAGVLDEKSVERLLETYHQQIAACVFALHERGPDETATLTCDTPLMSGSEMDGVRLRVARATQQTDLVAWPAGAGSAALPGCDEAERSDLLILALEHGSGDALVERSWLQKVSVFPEVDHEARTSAFLGRLSLPEFFRYLRSYLEPDAAAVLGDGDEAQRKNDGAPELRTRHSKR